MEKRLLRIREIARERGVVDRSDIGGSQPVASAETGYYGTPVLKRPVWTWEVPLYFFVGGAAGGCAVIGEVGSLSGADRQLVARARYLALTGAALSAPLLISDLGRPKRFLYMLRVFKWKSPMSVGVWTLVGFSGVVFAGTLLSLTEGRRRGALRRWIEAAVSVSGAFLGSVMGSYTGVLIGATVIPVWNRNVGRLPVLFAASALASAASALELSGRTDEALDRIALLTSAGKSASMLASGHEEKRASGRSSKIRLAASILSGPIPLALLVLGRKSRRARRLASLSQLAGSLLTRYGWVEAGRESADDSQP